MFFKLFFYTKVNSKIGNFAKLAPRIFIRRLCWRRSRPYSRIGSMQADKKSEMTTKQKTNFWIYLGISCIFAASSLSAAGPIMHAYLTSKWMEQQESYSKEQKQEMLVGTLFPDIRYMGVITREETHYQNIELTDLVQELSPFEKGKKFHSYVDRIRAHLVRESGIESQIEDIPEQQLHSFLKFLEDEILFNQTDTAFTIEALDSYFEEELKQISRQDVEKWHQILQNYFSIRPSELLATLVKHNVAVFNIPNEVLRKWASAIPAYAQEPIFINYTNNLVNNIFKNEE